MTAYKSTALFRNTIKAWMCSGFSRAIAEQLQSTHPDHIESVAAACLALAVNSEDCQ